MAIQLFRNHTQRLHKKSGLESFPAFFQYHVFVRKCQVGDVKLKKLPGRAQISEDFGTKRYLTDQSKILHKDLNT